MYSLENYNMFNIIRDTKRGGGVTMYVHKSLKACLEKQLSYCTASIEFLTLQVFPKPMSTYSELFSVIYRPPNSCHKEFISNLNNSFSQHSNKNWHLLGDFNIDILKYNSNVQAFYNMLESYNFSPKITKPTRISSKTSTLIDNIFNNTRSNSQSGILIHDISDHLPIF